MGFLLKIPNMTSLLSKEKVTYFQLPHFNFDTMSMCIFIGLNPLNLSFLILPIRYSKENHLKIYMENK